VKGIQLPIPKTAYAENIYWVFGIMIKDDNPMDNKMMQKLLAEKGIGSRTFFWCMHEQPVYNEQGMFLNEVYPNAEKMARKGLYIPSGLALTKKQMDQVIEAVKDILS
jgi:perosamine synthetase